MVKREKRYTFYSDGNSYNFYPSRIVFDMFEGKRRSALDFHKDLVTFRNSPTVFILDESGKEVV